MICEECKQNPATVSLVVSLNGEKTVRHLCADCMKKKSADMLRGDVGGFLASMLANQLTAAPKQDPDKLLCPGCGLSWGEFRKTGLLGCGGCYEAFAQQLIPILEKTQGCTSHKGSRPQACEHPRLVLEATVECLRQRMSEAVSEERFEEAAELRDQILSLTRNKEALS